MLSPAAPDPLENHLQALAAPDLAGRQSALKALRDLGEMRAVPMILLQLDAKEAPVRKLAVGALARLKDTQAIEPLIRTLQTDLPGVRAKAAAALAGFPDPRVVVALIAALQDADLKVVDASSSSLGRLGDRRAVPALIAFVEDPDRKPSEPKHWRDYGKACSASLYALGRLKDPQALPMLYRLLSDTDYMTSEAIGALAMLGSVALPSLLEMLESDLARMRWAAIEALTQMRYRGAVMAVLPLLKDPNRKVRCAATVYLGKSRDSLAVPALAESIDRICPEGVTALMALGEAGREAMKNLLSQSSGPFAALLAGVAQAPKPDPRFAEPILKLLHDNIKIRANAVRALAGIEDERIVPALISVLQDDRSSVREAIVRVLGHREDRQAIEPLIAALKDPEEAVVMEAIRSLGQLGDARAVEPLIEMLPRVQGVRYSNLRQRIIQALGRLGGSRAVDALLALAEEPDGLAGYDFETIAKALGAIGDRRASNLLLAMLQQTWSRYIAAQALAKLGDPAAVEPLIATLQEEQKKGDYWGVRIIVIALGELRDTRAIEPIKAAVPKDYADQEQLKALGRVNAVSALLSYMKSIYEAVRSNAIAALGEAGDFGDARDAVIHALNEATLDNEKSVRSAAESALARLEATAPLDLERQEAL